MSSREVETFSNFSESQLANTEVEYFALNRFKLKLKLLRLLNVSILPTKNDSVTGWRTLINICNGLGLDSGIHVGSGQNFPFVFQAIYSKSYLDVS